MAKLKIQKTYTNPDATTTTVDSYVSPITINSNHIGGTGGNEDQTIPTIACSFLRDAGGSVETSAYILFQKGMRKFEVNNTAEDSTTTATLVNALAADLTAANTMVIRATLANIAGANVANIGTGSGSYTNNRDYAYVTWTAANVTGYATPTVGYQIVGSGLTGNVTIVEVNSATNVTVSVPTQTVSTSQSAISETFAVSRISNKYVLDWSNTKWRYWFSDPYTDSVAVLGSQPNWQAVTFVRVDNA
jgi:hypothetical protein